VLLGVAVVRAHRARLGGAAGTVHWDKIDRLPKDLVLAAPGSRLMFDDRIYKRGALTLHALRVKLGDKVFFDMLRAWTKARAHKGVDTERFISHAEGFAKRSLAPFFDKWLWRKSLPDLPN
jgi:aminopeptidase N